MDIVFYGLSKKKNSTLQPAAGATSWTHTGTLKEPASILHPVIKIKRPVNDYVPVYTYAYISKFGRYYFVDDVRWVEPFWEISMSVDVLASYKTLIGLSSHYVLRTDSTNNFNGEITDTIYPATTDFDIETVALQNPFYSSLTDGCYIVGIISKNNTNSIGAITYYALSSTEFGSLKRALLSDDNMQTMGIIDSQGNPLVDDISQEVLKTMYNPYQYIVSCMWFPIGKSDITGSIVSSMDIGWWNYNLSGKQISIQTGLFFDNPELVPNHPQAATRGKYLNYAPYTKLTLYGKFGSLPIDSSYLEIGSYLMGSYLVDYITGECVYQAYVAENTAGLNRVEIARTSFMLGTPIQLAQVGVDYLGTATTAISAAADTASKAMSFNFGGAISSAANGIYNTLNASMPQLMTSGSNGSLVNSQLSTFLVALHFIITDEDIHHKGRPLCEEKVINTLSGYILCADGEFDISCFDEERTMIQDYLTSGFFWE